MKKHGIKPPQKPKGESAKITIANQEKQIKLLIDRCEELERQRTVAFNDADAAEHRARGADHIIKALENTHERMRGWQDCAREIFGQPPSIGEA